MNITEFQKSRFGLFIHWGIYSIPARGGSEATKK